MTYIELWRFFKLPIIQAPRRNSNLHKEMWSMARFSRWRRSACFVCAPLDEATRGRLIQVCSAIFGRLTITQAAFYDERAPRIESRGS